MSKCKKICYFSNPLGECIKADYVHCPLEVPMPVVHGRWEAHTDEYEICATEFTCSVCKESFCSSELTDSEFLKMMKYCSNCGAKMDGE